MTFNNFFKLTFVFFSDVDLYRTVTSFLPLMAAVSHVKGQGRILDKVWTELSGRMEYTVREKN